MALHRASDALNGEVDFVPPSALVRKLLRQHLSEPRVSLGGRDGWLYFLKRSEMVWIGFSVNPREPDAIVVPGTQEMEPVLHRYFASDMVFSKWFRSSKELTDLIEHLAAFAGMFWKAERS